MEATVIDNGESKSESKSESNSKLKPPACGINNVRGFKRGHPYLES